MKNNLNQTNFFSTELLKSINFKNGEFFTLLPENVNIKDIYEFEKGLIYGNSPNEYFMDGNNCIYSVIPTIWDELSTLIVNKVKHQGLSCVFDDTLRSAKDKHHNSLFYSHGLFFENEVYYLFKKNKISKELILEALKASNTFWHSLCVITDAGFIDITNQIISLEKIQEVVQKVRLLLVGAYDGEGYIFWEPITK